MELKKLSYKNFTPLSVKDDNTPRLANLFIKEYTDCLCLYLDSSSSPKTKSATSSMLPCLVFKNSIIFLVSSPLAKYSALITLLG